jgi:spore coat polysaccharide biosynthesis protein SpsF
MLHDDPRVVAIVSARMGSSRYPGKAIVPLKGRPLLKVLLERVGAVPNLDSVCLATSRHNENVQLFEIASSLGIPTFQGDEDDVLGRYVQTARMMKADHVVRVTGDNPLTDLETIERLVDLHLSQRADYTYVPGDALLMGILPEVISARALESSWERGEPRHRSELMTLYIKEHPQEFKIVLGTLPDDLYRPQYRLTVDEKEDVELLQALFERLQVPGRIVTTREAIQLLDREPELAQINAHLRHKAANLHSVKLDQAIAEDIRKRTPVPPAAGGRGRG